MLQEPSQQQQQQQQQQPPHPMNHQAVVTVQQRGGGQFIMPMPHPQVVNAVLCQPGFQLSRVLQMMAPQYVGQQVVPAGMHYPPAGVYMQPAIRPVRFCYHFDCFLLLTMHFLRFPRRRKKILHFFVRVSFPFRSYILYDFTRQFIAAIFVLVFLFIYTFMTRQKKHHQQEKTSVTNTKMQETASYGAVRQQSTTLLK